MATDGTEVFLGGVGGFTSASRVLQYWRARRSTSNWIALLNSAPVEDSLPARILAKSREVAAQSGHATVYSVGMDVGSTTVKAVIVNARDR